MASIDQNIRTYLIAIEIEGKTPRTIHSYAESLEDFRKLGRRLGLPETLGKYDVAHVLRVPRRAPSQGSRARLPEPSSPRGPSLLLLVPAYGHGREQRLQVASLLAKQEKKIRLPFERRDVVRLLGTLDRSSLKGCRDYALILFLLDTGVRVGECAIVRIEEVDWDEGQVLVHGKGQKQRYVGDEPNHVGGAARVRDRLPRRRPRTALPDPGGAPVRRRECVPGWAPAHRRACGRRECASPPLSTHLRYLGNRVRGARDGRHAAARTHDPGDDSSLRADVHVATGCPRARGHEPRCAASTPPLRPTSQPARGSPAASTMAGLRSAAGERDQPRGRKSIRLRI